MIDLTEQWKKGEPVGVEMKENYNRQLTDGTLIGNNYYVKTKDGETKIIYLCGDEYCKKSVRCKRLKILAPVPSYEEWEQLVNWAEFTDDYHALREAKEVAEYEKVELKELLVEAREYIIEHIINHIGIDPHCRHLMFKLKDVLHLNKMLERKDK